ncbi:MAG TPA: hypothetical protein VFZ65_23195 [Planctomycetota bacterium]|nr:hypothetical protein [Planctomycetota bacterium]
MRNELTIAIWPMLFLSPVAAQSVAAAVTALTPIAVHVASGTQTASNVQPAGPLPAQGIVQASLGSPGAQIDAFARWSTELGPASTRVWLDNVLTSTLGPSSSAALPQHEYLVSFTASPPGIPYYLELFRNSSWAPGAPLPLLAIDFDNDGSLDWANLPLGTTTTLPMVLGSQPKLVRVVATAQLSGSGTTLTTFGIAVRPHNQVASTQIANACTTLYGDLTPPVEVFADRGIDIAADGAGGNGVAVLHVIGLTPGSLALPPQQGVPCLLIPSPDYVLLAAGGPLHVPLPAALRPLTFYVQGVGVGVPLFPTQSPFATTTAYGVAAF